MKTILSFIAIAVMLFASYMPAGAAGRFMPRSGYTKQVGGNKMQKSTVEYDRGNQHYKKEVKGGQTQYTPRDAKNVRINGMPAQSGSRATVSPQGASGFND